MQMNQIIMNLNVKNQNNEFLILMNAYIILCTQIKLNVVHTLLQQFIWGL